MFLSILLGIMGGLAVSKYVARRHFEGGRCGGGARWSGPFRGGFGFGPHRFYRMVQDLGLDQTQRDQVRDIFHTGRRAMGEVRFSRIEQLRSLAGAMRAEKFDRAAVDAAAAHEQEKLAAARKELTDKMELFHSGLTSEQKAKLQAFLGHFDHGQDDHDGGPPRGASL